MAELFFPKIIDQLSDVALKQLGERVNLVMGVEEEVKNLTSKLTNIQEKLHDAERRRLKEKGVDGWLVKLEDITYEMEDVLDDWNIKVHKRRKLNQGAQVKVSRMSTLLKKVRSLISSFSSRLKEVFVRSEIALKIKEINGKLDLSLEEANKFNFVFTHGAHVDSNTFKRPMSTSIFDELEVHGRDDDKKILLDHLLSNSTASTSKEVGKDEVKVVSIVGTGGSGKTTLAKMLYNDDRVQKHFGPSKKWVCVSEPFDKKKIANALLESPEQSYVNVSELETLFQRIKAAFSGKTFLLVLDDVWTEEVTEWEPFKDSLKNGAPGSIILVTTRKDTVARVVGTHHMHRLGVMSDSDCWLVLKQIALSGSSQFGQRVETIGRKIAGKCKGLPLAAKFMGSLLRMKDTVEEWQRVLNSKIWQMEEASMDLFPHFYLSYNELPPQLKRCFSYCAMFPKDTKIDVERLIRLWMAQGYLGSQSQRVHDGLNVIGRDCFKNLAMRSFFQEFERCHFDENEIITCKMHDIVHDFAQFLTKNECRAFDADDCQREETNGGYLCKERVRHLTLLGKSKIINSSVILDIGKVRSLFFINSSSELIPQDLCSSLKSVRSLILSECDLQELPLEIGSLIHLRCLDVSSNNSLKELPETACDLHFLESLDVSNCLVLERLPQRIGDLVHLRYLLNWGTEEIKEMPPGLEKLTWLWNLGMFIADGTPLNNLGKLEHLNQLEQLNISVCGHVDFESAQLGKKIKLRILELEFKGVGLLDIESIEMMEPPPNLQQLKFYWYPRSQLPKWIVGAESLINNLTVLLIYGAEISSVPSLGKLSSLQILWLLYMPKVKHIGHEFYGLPDCDGEDDFKAVAFPSLRKLSISSLENWERWEDISEGDEEKIKNGTVSIMPRLETLYIFNCNSLEALPNRLLGESSSLKELRFVNCGRRLREKYSDKNGADWMKISHIPSVQIIGELKLELRRKKTDGRMEGEIARLK